MPILKNTRHEAFAQALAQGKSADESYQLAGFKANRGNASTLKANQIIADRVAELQGKAAAKAVVTIEDIARQLDEDRQFAREVGSAAASVAATMGKAKVLGLIVDKNEHTGKDGAPIEVARIERVIVRPANPDAGGV